MSATSDIQHTSIIEISFDGEKIFSGYTLQSKQEIQEKIPKMFGKQSEDVMIASLVYNRFRMEFVVDGDKIYQKKLNGKWKCIDTNICVYTTFRDLVLEIVDKYFSGENREKFEDPQFTRSSKLQSIYDMFLNLLRNDRYRRCSVDTNIALLPFKNGLVRLRTNKQFSDICQPDVYACISKTIPYELSTGDAQAMKQWQNYTEPFLRKVYFNNVQFNRFLDIVYRCIYRTDMASPPAVAWIQGGASSGKRTITRIIQNMFGDELCLCTSDDNLLDYYKMRNCPEFEGFVVNAREQKYRVVVCTVGKQPFYWRDISEIIENMTDGVTHQTINAFIFVSESTPLGKTKYAPENIITIHNDTLFYGSGDTPPERGVAFPRDEIIGYPDGHPARNERLAQNLMWYMLRKYSAND